MKMRNKPGKKIEICIIVVNYSDYYVLRKLY